MLFPCFSPFQSQLKCHLLRKSPPSHPFKQRPLTPPCYSPTLRPILFLVLVPIRVFYAVCGSFRQDYVSSWVVLFVICLPLVQSLSGSLQSPAHSRCSINAQAVGQGAETADPAQGRSPWPHSWWEILGDREFLSSTTFGGVSEVLPPAARQHPPSLGHQSKWGRPPPRPFPARLSSCTFSGQKRSATPSARAPGRPPSRSPAQSSLPCPVSVGSRPGGPGHLGVTLARASGCPGSGAPHSF